MKNKINRILPKIIKIKAKLQEDNCTIVTKNAVWVWYAEGKPQKIDWNLFDFDYQLKFLLQLFIIHRLKTRSLSTVSKGDIEFIRYINKTKLTLPFLLDKILITFLNQTKTRPKTTFRVFYLWCLKNNFKGFERSIYLSLKEYIVNSIKPYQKIFLQQNFMSSNEINKVYRKTKENINISSNNWNRLMRNVIFRIVYELAPRPSQFYLLNRSDFKKVLGGNNIYYSINMPMSKKIKSLFIEKRNRSISIELGQKIELLLELYKINNINSIALFIAENKKRLTNSEYTKIVIEKLNSIGINKTLIDLRHHLAQSLADQGSPAEIIAEILGHNSTVPARAYIAATPKIAEIKANALGKSEKYKNIISMLTTGKIIEKDYTNPERWVQGVVGNQYIGGIGSCGLPKDTTCPKNPVYACYTCIKFHPFKNGNHTVVKENLEHQIQLFIDIAENGNDIEHNRPVTQLNTSINAVNNVIKRIKNDYE